MRNAFRKLYGVIFFSLMTSFLIGQIPDLKVKKGTKRFEIPFEYENNFILVDVLFNGVFPLKFIFDTGAEHTVLTKREITDILQIDYNRRFTLLGADLKTELYAYLATGISMKINSIVAMNRSILVLDEDYFKFEEITGINVHGILGADFFRRFVVRINYQKKVITLFDPSEFKEPSKKFEKIPVEIYRNKPYVFSRVTQSVDTSVNVKLLVDTGASVAVMLNASSEGSLEMPGRLISTKIGLGLGGDIEGFLGRLEAYEIGSFEIEGVIANFQDGITVYDSTYLNGRDGVLGNQILDRFEVVIDYIKGGMYLLPNRSFKKKFKYDRSGITIGAGGQKLDVYKVLRIVKGSPAEQAGVQVDDLVLKINGFPSVFYDLPKITKKLKKRPGKKVSLVLLRNDSKIRVSFKLRDLI